MSSHYGDSKQGEMMICRIFIILISLIFSLNVPGHAGLLSANVKGKIRYKNRPLSDVKVKLINDKSSISLTDRKGRFSFKDVGFGKYTIIPEKEGYVFYPEMREITIIVTNETSVNFKAFIIDNSKARRASALAVEFLKKSQHPEGYWMGSFKSDTSFNAYYILLMHYLDMVNREREKKAAALILNEQMADGGWSSYPGGPGMVHIAVLNYFALKLAGHSPDSDYMKKARSFIISKGGADSANQFIQTMLALFGQVPWERMMNVSTDILRFESFVYRLGYLHTGIIPLSIIYENYYKKNITKEHSIRELFIDDPWNGIHEEEPSRGCCQKWGLNWIVTRQEKDGNWAGVFLNTMQCLMALKSTRNPAYNSVIENGMKGVLLFQIENSKTILQQFSQPPVMDTAYALHSLLSVGVRPDESVIKKALDYLTNKQAMIEGDWHHNNSDLKPGGWGFEHHNQWFPDIDCTAMVLDAFAQLDGKSYKSIEGVANRGLDWLVGMQNWDGGFSAWDSNTIKPPQFILDLFDMGWVYFDHSNADITARALLALSSLDYLKNDGDPRVINHAIKVIRKKQKSDGSWYGRWLVNYTYCTGQVLQGLVAAGEDPDQGYIRKAVKWLKKVQNPDGGWGETPQSYPEGKYAGSAKSTTLQTAYVLIGLISAGETTSPVVRRGIDFLVESQMADGSWVDEEYLGTGVPDFFYCRYELLPTPKALYAITLYLKEL